MVDGLTRKMHRPVVKNPHNRRTAMNVLAALAGLSNAQYVYGYGYKYPSAALPTPP